MESIANIYKDGNCYRTLLNVSATELINSDEVCFDKKNLIIRVPTIYDNKRYRIYRTGNCSAFIFNYNPNLELMYDITGKYIIEKEDDDYYFVKKIDRAHRIEDTDKNNGSKSKNIQHQP